MTFLPTRTDDEQTRITADFLPGGPPFIAKRIQSTNVYKFLKGLSKSIGRLEAKESEIADGRNLFNSTSQLERWERAVGIPDSAFPGTATIINRQRHALTKLASEGVHVGESDDLQSLQWLCELMGFSARVYAGHEFWPNGTDDRVTFSSEKESRFTIVIEVNFIESEDDALPVLFPVSFPWAFYSNNYNIMQEWFDEIIPANCQIKWIRALNIYKDTIGAASVFKDTLGASDVYKDRIGT